MERQLWESNKPTQLPVIQEWTETILPQTLLGKSLTYESYTVKYAAAVINEPNNRSGRGLVDQGPVLLKKFDDPDPIYRSARILMPPCGSDRFKSQYPMLDLVRCRRRHCSCSVTSDTRPRSLRKRLDRPPLGCRSPKR
jgi:hypothetical protein